MPTVNRYTQLQPARYTPRTLQELMIAPSYMREQHDLLDEGRAAIETQLAQVDPLLVHSDRAKELQEQLYGKMTQQADTLAREGFTPTSKSDFIRLNKEYQQAVGPTGELGKINAAKIAAEETKAEVLQNAINAGNDPYESKARIDEAFSAYEDEFRETQKVTNFEAPLPPKFHDIYEDIEAVKTMLNSNIDTKLASLAGKGYRLEVEPTTGGFVMVTKGGRVITESNETQIGSALKYLNSKWIGEGGAGTKTAEWNRMNKENIANTINSGLGMMKMKKEQDLTEYKYQYIAPKISSDKNKYRMPNYFRDDIPGINTKGLNPDSPLVTVPAVGDFQYDKGKIVKTDENSVTLAEKIAEYENDDTGRYVSVKYDPTDGITYATTNPAFTQDKMIRIPITVQNYDETVKQLDDIRDKNPDLVNMSDEELINTLNVYKENMKKFFVDGIDLVSSNYEKINDKFFGSRRGSGELTTGNAGLREVTINGSQFTLKDVVKEFGYDNPEEFKTEGEPSISHYIPTAGKWRASATNSEGDSVEFFINADDKLASQAPVTRAMYTEMLNGTSFKDLGEYEDPKTGNLEHVYFVNDFLTGVPKLVFTEKAGLTSSTEVKQIPDTEISTYGFDVINRWEQDAILQNDLFQEISGYKPPTAK